MPTSLPCYFEPEVRARALADIQSRVAMEPGLTLGLLREELMSDADVLLQYWAESQEPEETGWFAEQLDETWCAFGMVRWHFVTESSKRLEMMLSEETYGRVLTQIEHITDVTSHVHGDWHWACEFFHEWLSSLVNGGR